ncbi:MAG: glycosyltransferase [Burkholderiales bacterium]|nr:glycosyltransferase [Phycisphaerae bacterium]
MSVILAAYDAEKYLVSAVDSILNQTFTDFELILIDDGSKDSTQRMVQDYGRKDPRVVAISRANKGLTPTLNEGIARAKGEYLARMDADDLSLPRRFAEQVKYLDKNPQCVCVGCRVTLIDPYGSPLKLTTHDLDHEKIDAGLLKGIGWSIVHPAAMMRADAVRQVGGYREQFKTSQDLDLFLRLGEVGRLANIAEPLVQYRQHFESVANTKADEQWRVKSIIVGDAYDRRGLARPEKWDFSRRVPKPFDEQLEDWVWSALRAGNAGIARRHALALLKMKPFSGRSLKLMLCALRGR